MCDSGGQLVETLVVQGWRSYHGYPEPAGSGLKKQIEFHVHSTETLSTMIPQTCNFVHVCIQFSFVFDFITRSINVMLVNRLALLNMMIAYYFIFQTLVPEHTFMPNIYLTLYQVILISIQHSPTTTVYRQLS